MPMDIMLSNEQVYKRLIEKLDKIPVVRNVEPSVMVSFSTDFHSYLESNYSWVFNYNGIYPESIRGFPCWIDCHQYDPYIIRES